MPDAFALAWTAIASLASVGSSKVELCATTAALMSAQTSKLPSPLPAHSAVVVGGAAGHDSTLSTAP